MSDQAASTQILTDVIDPARARALQVTLGIKPTIESGSTLPPFFHHVYFWDPQPADALGRDGHPALGGFVPDMGPEFGTPRRMWAAGRLLFHGRLMAGAQAERVSVVDSVTHKSGKTGPLAFVRIRHDIRQRNTVVLSEWQDLVYRKNHGHKPEKLEAPLDETHSEIADFDTTKLFRYSALTFNGHRIHYDRPYTKQVEKYQDVVVHGPLLAQHLMLMAEGQLGKPLTEVNYRATSALTSPQSATLCWNDGRAWARAPDGTLCMEAQIR